MQSISRRGFVISAAAAGAAFGLDGPLEFVDAGVCAEAPAKDVVKFKVGDIEVIQMYDGIWEKAHDPRTSSRMPRSTRSRPRSRPAASPTRTCRSPSPSRRSGPRASSCCSTPAPARSWLPTAGNITKNDLWKAAGIDPAKVDTIVITHFHGDHITGLMAKDTNAPIFPNAKIYVPAAEYKFWTDPATTAGAAKRIQAVFPGWKNIKQFEGDKEVVPGVRAIATNGHTPGHTSYHRRLRQPAADRAGRRHQHSGPVREEPGLARGVRLPIGRWPRRTAARSSTARSPTR